MVSAYRSTDEFYWKCGLQRELSMLRDTGGKGTRITHDTDDYYWITEMQHTKLSMHVTCLVIIIQQFILYDSS